MNVEGVFSPRQILQILLPGLYVVSFACIPFEHQLNKIFSTESRLISLAILSILVGISIYGLEVPKRLWVFRKLLPTGVVKTRHPEIKSDNKFFEFYDQEKFNTQRNIIERYTGLYHFCLNITLSSLVILLIYLIITVSTEMSVGKEYFVLISITLGLSILGALEMLYGHKKLKYFFDRQVDAFDDWYKNIDH